MSLRDEQASSQKRVIKTPLANPWHYRRKGTYYLRIRPAGSTKSCSVSLRSTDKATAMFASTELQDAIRNFQLDDPEASWPDIAEYIQDMAARLLKERVEPYDLRGRYDMAQHDADKLTHIAATHPLDPVNTKTLQASLQLYRALQSRLHGDPVALSKLAQGDFSDIFGATDVPQYASLSLSVQAPESTQAVAFQTLADAYLAEHTPNIKPNTIKNLKGVFKNLAAAFTEAGVVDVSQHTRADLVKVKNHLSETRVVSTVNIHLTGLSTVLTWAVDNGLIRVNYSSRLKTTKGAESARKGFSLGQVETVLRIAAEHSERALWACALAAITGARLQEVLHLRKGDIKNLKDPQRLAMSINEADAGKSVKNKRSIRTIPLVDTCKWFDREAFVVFVDAMASDDERLFPMRSYPLVLGDIIRNAVGDDKTLVFHSFRHTISGLLQTNEVVGQTSAAILGHTTGLITFETYGTNMAQQTLRDALEKVLPVR